MIEGGGKREEVEKGKGDSSSNDKVVAHTSLFLRLLLPESSAAVAMYKF